MTEATGAMAAAALERRVAELMNRPLRNGEGFQLLRYHPGAASAPHFDFLTPGTAANAASLARSGEMKLQAGMPAEVYVKGGERTALQYLLEPVTDVVRRAGRER